MTEDNKEIKTEEKKSVDKNKKTGNNQCGALYGLGFVGAAIYYISVATGFWAGVVGFLKAMVWPVFLLYEVLKYIGA